MDRIVIIGGGFFGMYIAEYFARQGKKVLLCEKEADFMQRASYANQARVHNGYHYPRSICPHCGSDDTVYAESNGKGIIYSFSVMRRVQPNYAIAYVTVEDVGIKMMTNIVNCDFDALEIGQPVKVTFVASETGDVSVPMFEPA